MLTASNVIHFLCQFLYLLIYTPGYLNLSKWYDQYRINKGVKRPWEVKEEWPAKKMKTFIILGINYLVIYPLLLVVSLKLRLLRIRYDNFPSAYFSFYLDSKWPGNFCLSFLLKTPSIIGPTDLPMNPSLCTSTTKFTTSTAKSSP